MVMSASFVVIKVFKYVVIFTSLGSCIVLLCFIREQFSQRVSGTYFFYSQIAYYTCFIFLFLLCFKLTVSLAIFAHFHPTILSYANQRQGALFDDLQAC